MYDVNTWHDSCFKCIKSYKRKHSEDFKTHKEEPKFHIKCQGIPREYVDEKLLTKFTDMEHRDIARLLDPVVWAEDNLDWHCLDPTGEVWKRKNPEEYLAWRRENPNTPIEGHSRYHRPYQATMLSCSAKQKIFRVGRQAGKCLASGTLVQMADGTQKPVELIQDGDSVVAINDQYKAVIASAFRACNGVKPVYEVFLKDGRSIQATGNHPFLSRYSTDYNANGPTQQTYNNAWLDVLSLKPDDYIAVPRFCPAQGTSTIPESVLGAIGGSLTGNDEGVIESSVIREWFRILGFLDTVPCERFIPDSVMSLCNDQIATLLSHMFGSDGCAYIREDGQAEIGYVTPSKRLANQVISLLSRFGVYARLLTNCADRAIYISITDRQSIKNFAQYIHILGHSSDIEHICKISKEFPSQSVSNECDIVFVQIERIVFIGDKMTWDLTVPTVHNFIANNIITHNTETIVVSMLFHMVTRPGLPEHEGFKIIVIAPFQSQIDLIFTRIKELLASSPTLKNSIFRSVKAPQYMIELNNGSRVTGFTAGTKSGSGAGSARGQHAHMLCFDEADFLDSSDMDAAFSIITNHPDCKIWMSSTPIGKREKFYNTCHNPRWKEFHYPSSVNPMWGPELEATLREGLTSLGWIHEVEADFGEMEQGVFQHMYIKAAHKGYVYGDFTPDANWEYTLGVDWNDTANGTTIAVIGYDKIHSRYYIVDTSIIRREGWTQLKACEEIVRLNRFWKPMAIYLDKGHGGTQWELLRRFGYMAIRDKTRGPQHPDAKLIKVVPFDFGSNIETRDPFTGQKIQKPAKGFLVENAVRFFENGVISYPGSDDALTRQFQGYKIDHVSDSGRVVFKAGEAGDHLLDAVMLALVAYALEKSAIGKPKFHANIEFTSSLGATIAERANGAGDAEGGTFPDMTRTENVEAETSLHNTNLPAAHISQRTREHVWAWPGFLRDEPPPSTSASLFKSKNGGIVRRGLSANRPKRRNI